MRRTLYGSSSTAPASTWPPADRPPLVLPPCGSCPSLHGYDKDLSAVWPNGVPTHRDFLRASCWAIPIPGLPFLPGIGSSEHPERFLSYLFDCYPRWAQDIWLEENAKRCFSHAYLSWPNSRVQAGKSLSQFKESCQRVKTALPYLHVKLGSKDMDARDQTLEQWRGFLDPVMDALAGIADEYSFWEYDSFNTPGPEAVKIHKYFGQRAHAQGASFWAHFFPEVTSWFADGDSRGRYGFWDDLGSDVDGIDYQGKPGWDIGELQARLADTLKQFAAQGNRHKLRCFEPGLPSVMFTQDHPTEQEANDFGYLTLCTRPVDGPNGAAKVWGFGDGA